MNSKSIYNFFIFLILLKSGTNLFAQEYIINGKVKDNSGNQLSYVNIVFKNDSTLFGCTTDSSGKFVAKLPASIYEISLSSIGYSTFSKKISIETSTDLGIFTLFEDYLGLGEVVVSANLKETFISSSPVKISVYSAKYIQQNLSATNLMESVKLMNGVQEINACGVCNTNSISINGLPSAYTAILIDGTPAYGNLASVYALNGIPLSAVERIEVSKGPNSTLYGSEAMAGTINIITKDLACQPVFSLDLMATSDLELYSNLSFSTKIKKQNLLVGLQHAYSNYFEDLNKDAFGDNIAIDRLALFTKVSGSIGKKSKYQNFVKYLYEDRRNGVEAYVRNRNYRNIRGSDSIYGESIVTKRLEFMGTFDLPFTEKIRTDYSFSLHNQHSFYGADFYEAKQNIGFVNLIWNKKINSHDLMAGCSFRAQYYDDNTFVTSDSVSNNPDLQLIPGLWVQDEWEIVKNIFTIMPGLRIDYYNNHGVIPSPRINIKYKPSTWWTCRLNAGTGFRIVNLFSEDHAFVSGQRQVILAEKLKPERSYSSILNINHVFTLFGGQGSFDVDGYYTFFSNAIFADYSQQNLLIYRNLSGFANTFGTSFSVNYNFKFPLGFNLGVNLMNASEVRITNNQRTVNKLLFAPDYSAVLNLNYRLKKIGLLISYAVNLNGPMALPEIYDLDVFGNPQSTSRPIRSKLFSIHNLQIIKSFGNNYSCYIGIQNLLNYRQFYSPLSGYNDPNFSTGYSPFFDTSYSYSTIQGREYFIGLRMSIDKK